MSLPIISERLYLRRFRMEDVVDVLHFLSHPTVRRATPEIEPTEAGVRRYIETQISYEPFEVDKCFDLAMERKSDSRVIGMLTMVRRQHEQGELGYALGVEFRGKGLATEAASALMEYCFSVLGLHRIQASTSSSNPDSYRVMERLGMRPEGRMREAVYQDGAWHDDLVYGILEREWKARRG